MALTNTDLIKARIRAGQWFMDPFCQKAQLAIARLLDPSAVDANTMPFGIESPLTALETNTQPEFDLPTDVERGQVNFLTINELVKVHSIAINDPDFEVKCKPDDSGIENAEEI